MKLKKPWLAVLLNVILGLGYLYNGKRKIFGSILLIGFILIILECFYFVNIGSPLPKVTAFSYIAGFLYLFAFMYDAYLEARELNKR